MATGYVYCSDGFSAWHLLIFVFTLLVLASGGNVGGEIFYQGYPTTDSGLISTEEVYKISYKEEHSGKLNIILEDKNYKRRYFSLDPELFETTEFPQQRFLFRKLPNGKLEAIEIK